MISSARSRLAVAGLAAIGLTTLAGCAGAPTTADTSPSSASGAPSSSPTSTSTYADGTYTAQAGYQAPSGTESITVELTIADDLVTAVTVDQESTDREAREFQERFASGISAEVVGKDVSTLTVTRVSGSSLTSSGFNAAVDDIRAQAS